MDVESALKEYNNLEFSRLTAIRESLLSFSRTQSLISDEIKESFTALISQVDDIKIEEETSVLLRSVDILESYAINDVELLSSSDHEKNINIVTADFCTAERTKNFSIIFHKLQQTVEILDYLKDLVNNIGLTIKSVGDAKKIYSKTIYKCFEKHGFLSLSASTSSPSSNIDSNTSSQENNQIPKSNINSNMNIKSKSLKQFQSQFQSQLQSQLQSATGLDSTISNMFSDLNSDQFFELLPKVESPISIAVWNATVTSLKGIADGHSETTEKYYEYFLPTLSSVQRRIYAMKGDLMAKQIANMKLIDTAQATVLKLSQKVEKIRFQMKIQQEKVEKSKDDALSGGSGCLTPPPSRLDGSGTSPGSGTGPGSGSGIGIGGGSGSAESRSGTGSDVGCGLQPGDVEWENQMIAAGLRSVSPMNVPSDEDGSQRKDEIRRKATKAIQQGIDQFGSSLQKARMSVVAGLTTENLDDRLVRRETKMTALESEEKELLTVFYAANLNMEVIEETVKNEINSCLTAAKEVICHDILSFVDILKQLSLSQQEGVVCFEGPVKDFEMLCDSINLHNEAEHFISSVCDSYLSSKELDRGEDVKSSNIFTEKSNLMETPAISIFTPIFNKIIEDEKILLRLVAENYENKNEEKYRSSKSCDNQNYDFNQNIQNLIENEKKSRGANVGNEMYGRDCNYQQSQNSPNIHLFSTSTSSSSPVPTNDMLMSSDNFNFSSETVESSKIIEKDTDNDDFSTKSSMYEVININMNMNSEFKTINQNSTSPYLSPHRSHRLIPAPVSALAATILPTPLPSSLSVSVSTPISPVNQSDPFSHLTVNLNSGIESDINSDTECTMRRPDPSDRHHIRETDSDSFTENFSPTDTSSQSSEFGGSRSLGHFTPGSEVRMPRDRSNTDYSIAPPYIAEEHSMISHTNQEDSSATDFNPSIGQNLSFSGDLINFNNNRVALHTSLPQRELRSQDDLVGNQIDLMSDNLISSNSNIKMDSQDPSSRISSGISSGTSSGFNTDIITSESMSHDNLLKKDLMTLKESSLHQTPTLPPRPPLPPRQRRGSDVKEKISTNSNILSNLLDVTSDDENNKIIKMKDKQINNEIIKDKMDESNLCDDILNVSNDIDIKLQDKNNIRKKENYDSPTTDITRENSSNNIRKTSLPVSTGNKIEDTNELVKFGLSPNIRILESFSCALYPKKGLLTHGR